MSGDPNESKPELPTQCKDERCDDGLDAFHGERERVFLGRVGVSEVARELSVEFLLYEFDIRKD